VSHGSSDGGHAEPNLTPLLDVVLQLLMFFMMCVNFVNEQNNETIDLPESLSALPMDKSETDVLFVNVKPFRADDFKDRGLSEEGLQRLRDKFQPGETCVLTVGRDPMKPIEAKYWLKQEYEDAQKKAADGKVQTAVVIRADRDTDYAQVFQLLQMCKVQGYTRLKLRAMTKVGGNT
jgi:biopolymer transport protein ExbD